MMPNLPPMDSVKRCEKCGCRYHGEMPDKTSKEPWYQAPDFDHHRMRLFAKIEGAFPSCCIDATDDAGGISLEHLSRICLRCGYRWAEAIWEDPQLSLPT